MSDVLIVDDEAPFRRVLHKWIHGDGMTAMEAESAEQALLLASVAQPRVVLCDIRMPRGQTGFWLIEQLRQLHPEAVVVVTSALHDAETIVEGVRAHVSDYLVKPFTREKLKKVLTDAFAEHETKKATTRTLRALEGRNEDEAQVSTSVAALLAVLRAQGEATTRHAVRVSQLAVAIARKVGIDQAGQFDIARAALLRGIERLDVHGIARIVPFVATAATIRDAIEERFDGRGFPLGLKGEVIPRGARIIAAAEAFNAMAATPNEQTGIPVERAVDLLEMDAGRFDPAVLHALRSVVASHVVRVA